MQEERRHYYDHKTLSDDRVCFHPSHNLDFLIRLLSLKMKYTTGRVKSAIDNPVLENTVTSIPQAPFDHLKHYVTYRPPVLHSFQVDCFCYNLPAM